MFNSNDYEVFFYSLQASKATNVPALADDNSVVAQLASPIWNLGILNTRRALSEYDIFIQPIFFNAAFDLNADNDAQIDPNNPYYEVVLVGQSFLNVQNQSQNNAVLFRGMASLQQTKKNAGDFSWVLLNEEMPNTFKMYKINDPNFLYSNINIEIRNQKNEVLSVGGVEKIVGGTLKSFLQDRIAKDFNVVLKILLFPKTTF